jgi:hypothetical protein
MWWGNILLRQMSQNDGEVDLKPSLVPHMCKAEQHVLSNFIFSGAKIGLALRVRHRFNPVFSFGSHRGGNLQAMYE